MPVETPTNFREETPASSLTPKLGEMANLRLALRSALSEAASTRMQAQYQAIAPTAEGLPPGSLAGVVSMIRSGAKAPAESMFSDIISGYKEASDARQKEMDRISELRATYGSLVPSNITDLKTALDLIAPTVDKERKLKLEKMAKDQAADNDVESWAQFIADGGKIGNVPQAIRTKAKVRSDAIIKTNEEKAKEEYKSRIAFRLERKTSNFEVERSLAAQDDNLTTVEMREILDYIDTLEQQQKASGGKGFGFLSPARVLPPTGGRSLADTLMEIPPPAKEQLNRY